MVREMKAIAKPTANEIGSEIRAIQPLSGFGVSRTSASRGGTNSNPTGTYSWQAGKYKGKQSESYLGDEFEPFIRRFGKDISLGKFKTKQEAEEELFGKIDTTLGASGKLKKSGRSGEEFIDISSKYGLTRSKSDPLRFVEPRSRRLSRRSEVSEIFGFQKKKKKKSTNLDDFIELKDEDEFGIDNHTENDS